MSRWSDKSVESMYDKTLLAAEVAAIKQYIKPLASVCDAGCGEGEGTAEYAKVAGNVYAFDACEERLDMARGRVHGVVVFEQEDVLNIPPSDFDVVVSQRLLINLANWGEQKRAISRLYGLARDGGLVILSEGSADGVSSLNQFRRHFGLPAIPVPEHNCFLFDELLKSYAEELGLKLIARHDFGTYYLLTRGVQPALTSEYKWDSAFNAAASKVSLPAEKFSRVKVWVFQRGSV